MNPTSPVGPVSAIRVPAGSEQKHRRDRGAGRDFQQALQQEGAPLPHPDVQPPTAAQLQPRPPYGRNRDGTAARHVDVVA